MYRMWTTATIKTQIGRMGKVIKDAGIRAD
jgi:hypothetical protein